MRTNIVIDDKLIAEAMKLSGAKTKREAVEDSLRLMVQLMVNGCGGLLSVRLMMHGCGVWLTVNGGGWVNG